MAILSAQYPFVRFGVSKAPAAQPTLSQPDVAASNPRSIPEAILIPDHKNIDPHDSMDIADMNTSSLRDPDSDGQNMFGNSLDIPYSSYATAFPNWPSQIMQTTLAPPADRAQNLPMTNRDICAMLDLGVKNNYFDDLPDGALMIEQAELVNSRMRVCKGAKEAMVEHQARQTAKGILRQKANTNVHGNKLGPRRRRTIEVVFESSSSGCAIGSDTEEEVEQAQKGAKVKGKTPLRRTPVPVAPISDESLLREIQIGKSFGLQCKNTLTTARADDRALKRITSDGKTIKPKAKNATGYNRIESMGRTKVSPLFQPLALTSGDIADERVSTEHLITGPSSVTPVPSAKVTPQPTPPIPIAAPVPQAHATLTAPVPVHKPIEQKTGLTCFNQLAAQNTPSETSTISSVSSITHNTQSQSPGTTEITFFEPFELFSREPGDSPCSTLSSATNYKPQDCKNANSTQSAAAAEIHHQSGPCLCTACTTTHPETSNSGPWWATAFWRHTDDAQRGDAVFRPSRPPSPVVTDTQQSSMLDPDLVESVMATRGHWQDENDEEAESERKARGMVSKRGTMLCKEVMDKLFPLPPLP
ncbi:MAG: hypothetical protein M1820_008265 [Bogoriella megaspora]|nr:MAG: hypothetical protein M1820_008265 [Bogoriella megaspora]